MGVVVERVDTAAVPGVKVGMLLVSIDQVPCARDPAVVLKTLEHARRQTDPVYIELQGRRASLEATGPSAGSEVGAAMTSNI